jgi:putative DNA-invertase from lambdoid prophage Rac
MATYGYVRVSTDRQADDGDSLEIQERRCRAYAEAQNLVLDRLFIERGVSGSVALADRPAGAELLATVQRGDTVIAVRLDRMFRSALDALTVADRFRQDDIGLHLLDLGGSITNGLGKAFFTIASAFAEAERDRIRERIQEVKSDQRQRNRYLGGRRPLGWTVGTDGELVEVPAEQQAIRRMVEARDAGQSLRAIAADLQAAGFNITHAGADKIIRAAKARSIAAAA